MRFAFLAVATGLVVALPLACSDDEQDEPTGGTGGGGASDASSGSGGSGLSAGSGGSAALGGSAGSSASGGVSGSGGAAGMDAGPDGSEDDAGDASPEAAAHGKCTETCSIDADCDDGSTDPFVCDQNKRCRQKNGFSSYCKIDADCIAQASNWTTACTSSLDCPSATQVCVEIGASVGKCAYAQGNPFCTISPDQFSMTELGGDAGSVTVCGDQDGMKCHPTLSVCVPSCQTNTDCPPAGEAKTCVAGGICGCSQHADCASGFCDPVTGRCGCKTNTDCPAQNPICIAGKCGCGGQNDCSKTFMGTTLACQ